nr:Jag N-terminal domain-containing protein [Butyrivibrio sp.]
MEYKEFTAKNVDDAITEACESFCVTSDKLDYEVVSSGSSGFLGIKAKPAIIKARVKEDKKEEIKIDDIKVDTKVSSKQEVKSKKEKDKAKENVKEVEKTVSSDINADEVCDKANKFLKEVFDAMKMEVVVKTTFNQADKILDIELSGDEMGVLIGKRGQTLDSVQYLVSLVVNRDYSEYIHVKVDTENYRERRKATLENLAKNISYKVRKSRHSVALEPMNPYERRIIHSALQGD